MSSILVSFWRSHHVSSANQEIAVDVSKIMSMIVTTFCYDGKVDMDLFLKLTDKTMLPHVHGAAAPSLLKFEDEIVDTDDYDKELSCLQHRCVKAMTSNWHEYDASFFQILPQNVLVPLLSRVVVTANCSLRQLEERLKESEKRIKKLQQK